MPYSSSEIKQVEYYVTLEDGTKKLILSQEDGDLVEVDVTDDYTRLLQAAPGTTFVPFGDSYVDRSGTQTYIDGAARHWDSIVMWTELLMCNRLRPLNNAGVNGQITSQFLDRIQSQVLNYKPSLCLLLTPGLNDVKGVGTTLDGTKANLTLIFDKLAAAGILCLTITVPPSNLIDTIAEKQFLFSLNRWLLNQANIRKGLIVVDAYSPD